jgi:hypothetical protein
MWKGYLNNNDEYITKTEIKKTTKSYDLLKHQHQQNIVFEVWKQFILLFPPTKYYKMHKGLHCSPKGIELNITFKY